MLVLAFITAVYLIVQVGNSLSTPYETVTALYVTVNDSISASGYFIREETVVPGTVSNTVEYTVQSGEKVRRGEELAVEYTDASTFEASKEMIEKKETLALLESVSQNLESLSDGSKLDQLITMQMMSINETVGKGNLGAVAELSAYLRELMLKRNLTTEDKPLVDAKIAETEEEIRALGNQTGEKMNNIYAEQAGYFSEVTDGYEELLTVDKIDTMTAGDLLALSKPAQAEDTSMGKIIGDFCWYFATVVSPEDAGKYETGRTYRLRFGQIAEDIPATLYRAAEDENGVLLVFRGMVFNEDLISMRNQSVEIIQKTYEGLKVPKDAVRMEEDVAGVYILTGSISKFKEIEVLYEDDTYYIIKKVNGTSAEIIPGDTIVVTSKALSDKKVVK